MLYFISMNETAGKVLSVLKKEYPKAKVALQFRTPMEMLVSTILSAQCTDKRVNLVTKDLFRKYKTVEDYAGADVKEFEGDIRSTGFYRAKAKNIIGSAKKIISDFSGKIPDSMEKMLTLPGVARKTANIVLYNVHGVVSGIPVDTHVRRLSQRLGFSKHDDPVKIEKDLMAIFPKKEWGALSYYVVEHGRRICQARNPKCLECVIAKYCPSYGKFTPFNSKGLRVLAAGIERGTKNKAEK